MAINWSRFKEILEQHQSFVLTTHMRPDCDALGSVLAMAMGLETLGKTVQIVCADEPPPHIRFIDPTGRIKILGKTATAEDVLAAEVFMVLDTSAWVQIGPMGDLLKQTKAKKVVLDHHQSSDEMGAEVFKEDTAEANGRLVLECLEFLGVTLTTEIAIPLFVAIATDTGWFRFSSVNSNTYQVIARLVAAGAQPAQLYETLYEQNSMARLLLQGRVLSKAKIALQGRMIYSLVTLADLTETGALPSDLEDVVNRLMTVAGIEAAGLFLELESGATKISLRSKTDLDVSAIAETFQGGGHKKAAGIRFEGSLVKAERAILDAMQSVMG